MQYILQYTHYFVYCILYIYSILLYIHVGIIIGIIEFFVVVILTPKQAPDLSVTVSFLTNALASSLSMTIFTAPEKIKYRL